MLTCFTDEEIEDLRRQIANLEHEKRDWKRLGGDGAAGARDTQYLRNELGDLEHQITLLQAEVKEKDRLLYDEKQTSDRVSAQGEIK